MLGRVAENLYWLGRYLERAENLARMADVHYYASVELGEVGAVDAASTWSALIAATGASAPPSYQLQSSGESKPDDSDESTSPEHYLLYSEDNPSSLRRTVAQARDLARGLREHISTAVWEEINELHFAVGEGPAAGPMRLHDFCETVKHRVAAVYGRFDNTVPYGEGHEWFRSGTFIERADMTSRIIDAKYFILLPSPSDVGGSVDRLQWMGILRSAGALEAFRRRSHGVITGPSVADMLIFDREFPRSLAFCVTALQRHYAQAAPPTTRRQGFPAARELTLLRNTIGGHDIDSVITAGLHEFLDSFQSRLIEVDRAVTNAVFRALPAGGASR